MLDFIDPSAKKQRKEELEAEQRQMNFAREQNTMQSVQDSSDEMSYLQQQEFKADLLKWQQDLGDEGVNLILTLLGMEKINGKLTQVRESMCNEKFIYEVVKPQITPFTSRNLINSNYDEITILNDLKHTCNEIADAMADNYDDYDILFTNFDLILRLIKNTIKPGILRALKGWTKNTDSTIIKRIEAMHEQQSPQKNDNKILGII